MVSPRRRKLFTGLENLQVDPERGLILPVRTKATPYSFTREGEETIYQQRMPESFKAARFAALEGAKTGEMPRWWYELGASEAGRKDLKFIYPEYFGMAGPSELDYPKGYKPVGWDTRGQVMGQAQVNQAGEITSFSGSRPATEAEQPRQLPTNLSPQATWEAYLRTHGVSEADIEANRPKAFTPFEGAQTVPIDPKTGQPIPPKEFLSEAEFSYWRGATQGVPPGWQGYPSDQGRSFDYANYLKSIEGQRPVHITSISNAEDNPIATLSNGETFPISVERATAWTGEKPSPDVLAKLPPGAIFLGYGYDKDGNRVAKYLPAEAKYGGLIGGTERQDIEQGVEMLSKFSDDDIGDLLTWAEANPANLVQLAQIVRDIGRQSAIEKFVKRLVGPEDVDDALDIIFQPEPSRAGGVAKFAPETVPPAVSQTMKQVDKAEGVWKDIWDALVLSSGMSLQQTKTALLRTLPRALLKDVEVPEGRKSHAEALEKYKADVAAGVDPQRAMSEFMAATSIGDVARKRAEQINATNKQLRDIFNRTYAKSQAEFEDWIKKNPQLQPRPEWEKNPSENWTLLKDPGYWGYQIAQAAPYMVAVMGTSLGVTALTKNPVLGLMAGSAVAMPQITADLEDDLLANGATQDQAAAMATMIGPLIAGVESIGNVPFLKALAPSAMAMFRKEAGKEVAKLAGRQLVKKAITTAGQVEMAETLEEVFQQAIQNAAVKTVNENRSLIEGLADTAIIAGIASMPFAVIGGVSVTRPAFTRAVKSIAGDLKTQFEDAVASQVEAGADGETAQVMALNEVAKTPEGKTWLARLITEETGAIEVPGGEEPEIAKPTTSVEGAKPFVKIPPKFFDEEIHTIPQALKDGILEVTDALPFSIDSIGLAGFTMEGAIGTEARADVMRGLIRLGSAKLDKSDIMHEIAHFYAFTHPSILKHFQNNEELFSNRFAQYLVRENKGLPPMTAELKTFFDDLFAKPPAVEAAGTFESSQVKPLAKPPAPKAEVPLVAPVPSGAEAETKPPIAEGVPPVEPPKPPTAEATPTIPVPPPNPVERTRIITQATEQVRQNHPGIINRALQHIPGIKQIMQFERPGLKMTGENEKVLVGMVAQASARNDVTTRELSTRLPLLRSVKRLFGDDALRGGKVDIKFLGTPEQAQNPITNTLKDIAENPEMYELSEAQKEWLADLQARNDESLAWVVDNYGAEIGRFTPKEGGAFLPNVDIDEDIIEWFGSETRTIASGRGKTRIWQTARERMASDKTFKPETDVQKLIEGMDSFKASVAGGQTFRETLGGMTRLEVLQKTHPELYAKMEALRKRLSSLQSSVITIESNLHKQIDGFLRGGVEPADIDAMRDALDIKLKSGPRKGFDMSAIQDEITKVRDELSALRPAWEAANPKPYVFIQQGLYRYFPSDQAKLIQESLRTTDNPLLKFIERWRGGAFSGDISPLAIQGAVGVLTDPLGNVKTGFGGAKTAIEQHDILRAFKIDALADDIAASPDEWAQFASLRGMGLSGTPAEYAAGFLSKIPGFDKFTEATYITVTREGFAMWKRTTSQLMKAGTPELEAKVAAIEMVNEVYPFASASILGQSQARAMLLRAVPTSYSFIRKPIEMTSHATTGFGKLVAFQKLTAQEKVAVKLMVTLAASTLAASAASAWISAKARGDDDDKALTEVLLAIDPTPTNGKFASLVIGDKRIPLGGPYRALFRAMYPQEVKGLSFPVPFAGLFNYAKNRITPSLAAQLDLIVNKDYSGQPIIKGEFPENLIRGILYEFESALPLTAGTAAEAIREGEKYRENVGQQIISQFMGVNMVTLDNTYVDRERKKLGLPKPDEDTEQRPLSIKEVQYYDVGDYSTAVLKVFGDLDPATMTERKGYKPIDKAIVESEITWNSVKERPNVKLSSINADPSKGDTFKEYYNQWLERSKIDPNDEKALKAFDKKYPQAEQGNMSQRQFALLQDYHQIAGANEKETFLKDHPEIVVNPREDYLKTHPDDNAVLALRGKTKPLTQAAYDKMWEIAKSLDIPDSAMPKNIPPKEVAKAYFGYQDLLTKFEAGSTEVMLHRIDNLELDKWLQTDKPGQKGLQPAEVKSIDAARLVVKNREKEKELKAINGRDTNETNRLRDEWKAKNEPFMEDQAKIEAYNIGLTGNLVETHVQKDKLERQGKFKDYEDDWFWQEQGDYYQKMVALGPEKGGIKQKNFSLIPTREVARKQAEVDAMEALPKAKFAFLNRADNADLKDWQVKSLKAEAKKKGMGEQFLDKYAEYRTTYFSGYEDEWFKMENRPFYQEMVRLGIWKGQDFSAVPSRAIAAALKQYEGAKTDAERLRIRRSNAALDQWLIKYRGYKPLQSTTPTKTPAKTPAKTTTTPRPLVPSPPPRVVVPRR